MSPETDPTDRAIGLLQRTRELLLECRSVAERLSASPAEPEPPAVAAERIAYGVLVAALGEGLVSASSTPTTRMLQPPACDTASRRTA